MTQPDWPARLVAGVAGEVRRHRLRRDMSAQQLADRCAELGMPIQRSVLANLESGRRSNLSLPELFVLAQALEVPPLLLMLPLGHADTVEILPGAEVLTTDALRWLRGEAWVLRPPPEGEDGDSAVASFVVHHARISAWETSRYYVRRIRAGEIKGTEDDIEEYERRAENAAEQIKSIRHLMRVRGLTPPPLPVSLAYVDEEETP